MVGFNDNVQAPVGVCLLNIVHSYECNVFSICFLESFIKRTLTAKAGMLFVKIADGERVSSNACLNVYNVCSFIFSHTWENTTHIRSLCLCIYVNLADIVRGIINRNHITNTNNHHLYYHNNGFNCNARTTFRQRDLNWLLAAYEPLSNSSNTQLDQRWRWCVWPWRFLFLTFHSDEGCKHNILT